MSTTLSRRKKLTRADVPEGAELCSYCTAKCCKYLALPIETPKVWKDFDEIRWFLAHQNISIFVDGGNWYILIHNQCEHLQADNRCGIYMDRPQICRDYKTDACEFDDDYTYEKIFENDDQIWEYAEAVLGPQKVHPRTGEILGWSQ